MQATSAEANKAASSASDSPLVMCTMSEIPSSAMSLWVGPLGSTLATSRSSRSRTVRSRATACSRVRTPLSGVSALAMAMIRPGWRGPEPGLNSSVFTPSGTTCSCSGETPKSEMMSAADDDETVNRSGMWRATSCCMAKNPYQRRTNGFRHHRAAARSSTRSRVIGWCTVATTGSPAPAMLSRPVPRLWLSCTTSKSAVRPASNRAARSVNVRGSGKPAVQVVSSSKRSMESRISLGRGTRNGSGSRYRSRLGTSVSRTRGSSRSGYGCPENTSTS